MEKVEISQNMTGNIKDARTKMSGNKCCDIKAENVKFKDDELEKNGRAS